MDGVYRNGVGICVFNCTGMVFVGKRFRAEEGAWQMPQGGVDNQEEHIDAALRELREEIGTDNVEFIARYPEILSYSVPGKYRPKKWSSKANPYKGQKQAWFLMKFLGEDSDIDLYKHGSPEFEDWKWSRVNELANNVIFFKKELYTSVVREFEPIIKRTIAQ